MTNEKLIATLRNRATAYSPQSQQETMLEAAAVIEEYDRAATAKETPATERRVCRNCEYYDDSGELSAKPICSHSHGMDEPQPTDYCSRYTPWEDAAAPPDGTPKPSPEAVIKSLEACAEPFACCDDCAFGPGDPYDYGCADKLKLAAAELLRAKYGE